MRRIARTWVAHCGGKRRPSVGGNSPMRGETIWTVAPWSVSQRWAPRISTSSTPLVQQMAMRLPLSRLGSDGGSNRKFLSSRFNSPSAVVRSSVEMDGTGDEDVSCCIRWTAAAWMVLLIFVLLKEVDPTSESDLLEGTDLLGQRSLDRQPPSVPAAALDRDESVQDASNRGDGPRQTVHVPS